MFVSVWLFTVLIKVMMVCILVGGGAIYHVLCMSMYICVYVLGSVPKLIRKMRVNNGILL